ncbi:helix-turn-helix transcriptional regulator [Cupriavidus agavae]|uniref:Regulatory LuxR family protein n=1 Tax=Cupriavidus agavae TaxID=1001822 RepID=A0A4V2FGF5_9BURK|nr:LuxR C-terminal-related transcriptional regulator [Cupriavidus agavae]RZT36599.1 regulatory LuxR family protein [Cupriavidus agavae]
MRAAVLEARPLVGIGIQRVLHRIAEIEASSVVSPQLGGASSLRSIELLVVGELLQGYSPAMLELLGSASAVRCVLYMGPAGEVQWMPPRQIPPLLSWLPEHASPEAIEHTVRVLIASLRAAGVPAEDDSPDLRAGHVASPTCQGGGEPIVIDPRLFATPLVQPMRRAVSDCVTEARLLNLTQRQYDVLVLLSKGMSIKLISRRLHISVPTVKSHTLQIYRRLAASNKTEAVFVAREKGARLEAVSTGAAGAGAVDNAAA